MRAAPVFVFVLQACAVAKPHARAAGQPSPSQERPTSTPPIDIAGPTREALGPHDDLPTTVASPVAQVDADEQPQHPTAATAPTSSEQCDPNYRPCVPIDTDVDCEGGNGNGPSYVRGPVYVIGTDIYGLDRDGDGVGCERTPSRRGQ